MRDPGPALTVLAQHGIRAKVVGDAAYLAGVLNATRAGLGVTLLALAGAPPEGLIERHDLPAAAPISLTARFRPGADTRIAGTALRVLRSTLTVPPPRAEVPDPPEETPVLGTLVTGSDRGVRIVEATGTVIAAPRPGMPAALAGLVVGLAYAAISVYWAVGGQWLLDTVGISLSQPGRAGLLAVWGAAVLKAVAAVLPVLAVLSGRHGPRDADRGRRRLVRVLTWIEAVILVGYGLVLTLTGLLVQAGVVKASAHADHLALRWHAYLWDPWFLIWGLFVLAAAWRSRPVARAR